jgi:hypothetical protein
MSRVEQYLQIPEAYCRWLGGLRWSANGEAVEHEADDPAVGLTFAMAPEIALFLEGFQAGGPLVCFGFVLHLLHLLGVGGRRLPERPDEPLHVRQPMVLAQMFHELNRPLRNAGALCARLCREVPRASDPPEAAEVALALSRPPVFRGYGRSFLRAEVPPLEPFRFESRVLRALSLLADADLRHWLRRGRGPLDPAGEQVAREAAVLPPRTLEESLAALERRERLSGSAHLVPHLAGALTLPARRLTPAELPTGGYADVATRGLPEQILPGQFALEADEFLRRFAERELLYFHREEPRAPTSEELVVLLDQGVRTWGEVRLVLSAAALALGRQAARRRVAFRVAATSQPGRLVDPLAVDDEALGALLEASDLSPHPGPALARVLEAPADRPRDVVLLTHPRSLAEPEVAAAARTLPPGARLFAVAVEPDGRVELSELRRGIPVAVAGCRVEIRPAAEPRTAPPVDTSAWRGDVEPVGFPFPFGLLNRLDDAHFDLDDSGEWLLAAGIHGLLHLWRADGTRAEILPRGLIAGEVLSSVEAVVGVAGGFVVAGRTRRARAAVHYDLGGRNATAYPIATREGAWYWDYVPQFHTVLARNAANLAPMFGMDLGQAAPAAFDPRAETSASSASRAAQALAWAHEHSPQGRGGPLPPVMSLYGGGPRPSGSWLALRLDPATGAIDARTEAGAWPTFTPLADGEPALRGASASAAQCSGDVLALLTGHASQPEAQRKVLRLYAAPDGRSLGDYPAYHGASGFVLTRDGRRFARRVGDRQVEVRDVRGGPAPLLVTARGRTHSQIQVGFAGMSLVIRAGKHAHQIRWGRGPLELSRRLEAPMDRASNLYRGTPAHLQYDPRRFVAMRADHGLTVVADVFGQVAVFDRDRDLICMFLAFRDQLAGWMPDGTRLGSVSLLGGRPSPDAPERIAAALRAAQGLDSRLTILTALRKLREDAP